MFIKFIDAESEGKLIRFFVNHSGVQWYVKRELEEVVEMVKGMAKSYHTADFFKSNMYRRFLKLVSDPQETAAGMSELFTQVMTELTSLYVIRKDATF